MQKPLKLGVFLVVGVLLIIFSKAGTDGAKDGIDYCLNILIPALFPFMVFSAVLMRTGVLTKAGRISEWVARKLFRLPGCTLGVILIGVVGGYPLGAVGTQALYREGAISRREAEQLSSLCVCAGPSFLITAVGTVMLGSVRQGLFLFLSQIIAVFILAIVTARIPMLYRHEKYVKKLEMTVPQEKQCKPPFSEALVGGVRQAISSMGMICGLVVIFSVVTSVLNGLGIPDILASLLSHIGIPEAVTHSSVALLLEVVSGCRTASANYAPLELLAFALGFGGICVHLQIASLLSKEHILKKKFILFRIAQGFIAAIVVHILLMFFPEVREVFLSTGSTPVGSFYRSATECLALTFMCVIFLCTFKNKSVEIRL